MVVVLAAGSYHALADPGDLLLDDVTIVSPEREAPLVDAWVAVRNGRIVALGDGKPALDGSWSDARVLHGQGAFLTPGLIDSHVHLAAVPGFPFPVPEALRPLAEEYELQLPRSYLYFGFTTVIDLNVMDQGFLDRFEQRPLHPDLYHCGGALVIANGYPMAFLPPETRFDTFPNFLYDPARGNEIPQRFEPEDHTPAATVSRVADSGGICVKTHWETGFGPLRGLPTPSEETIAEVIRESRARDLVVTMHANSLDAHRFAVRADVDVIVHGLWNAPSDPAGLPEAVRTVLDTTIEKRIGYMPTMQVLAGMQLMFEPGFLEDPALAAVLPAALIEWYRTPEGRWFVEELRTDFDGLPDERIAAIYERRDGPLSISNATVAYLAGRDTRFLFGSDTPSSPTYGNPPGLNGYLEMQNLVAAGVSPRQVLAAATIANAEAFNLDDRYGTIEAGKVANLLLLKENPLQAVTAWDTIETVVLHGAPVERRTLSAVMDGSRGDPPSR